MFPIAAMIPVFSLALFCSALLLFWVEPMFGKMILPLLGGTPAVWVTAMMFYQLALLAGYAYAHVTSHWFRPARQALIHLCLLLLALFLLPVTIPSGWTPPTEGNPAIWLVGLLTVALGLPFVLLSATTPIVQRWFTATRHRQASDPYFLYAVSNAGSVAGLFAYPFLLEPRLRLVEQSHAWSIGFVILVGLVGISALLGWRYRAVDFTTAKTESRALQTESQSVPVEWKRVLHWIVLAFVPSSLMLSVTTFITTDIAAIPLMWMIPLFLYLLTFIIVFSRKPAIPNRFALWLHPFLIAPLCIALVPVLGKTGISPLGFLSLHLAVFFFSTLVCHFELSRLKPDASQLTKYFLAISFGGALGGIFNVLVAPSLFNDVYEYPLGLVVACLLRPWPKESIWRHKSIIIAAVAAGLAVFTSELLGRPDENSSVWLILSLKALLAVGAMLVFATRRHPLWLGIAVGLYLLATIAVPASTSLLHIERNFFGVLRVRVSPDGTYRMLEHGTTVHGIQALDTVHKLEPLSYFSRYGGLGEALTSIASVKPSAKIGVIGLGAGSLVCYGNADWHYTFYEIDPGVVRVARDPKLFSFLSSCGHANEVVLGDGRLSIQRVPDGYFDAVVLDAFSSDVIPLHLLTQEAMQIYLSKLAPGGIIILHLSNRYFDLAPIVAVTARDLGLAAIVRVAPSGTIEGTTLPYFGSIAMSLARRSEDFGSLANVKGWQQISARPGARSWSDDYSDLLQALFFRSSADGTNNTGATTPISPRH